MEFRKDGEHVIEVHGRVLLRRIIGSWNMEHYVKIPPEMPHRICETEEEALAWPADLGFPAAGYSSETQDS